MSCVMCHMSRVTFHVSRVTCHLSCVTYLAALSSSRSLVVRWSLGPLVGRSVGRSVGHVCDIVDFRILKGN